MSKKIVFFGVNLYGTGGVESVLTLVSNHLSASNDVIVISNNSFLPSKFELDKKVKVIYLNPFYKYRTHMTICVYLQNRILDFLKKIKVAYSSISIIQYLCIHLMYTKYMRNKLIDIINDINPDYVVGIGRSALLLGLISDKLKCTKIGWQHNLFESFMNYDKSNFWPNASRYIPKLLSRLDMNLVLSEHDKNEYANIGVNCMVMPNFVDISNVSFSSLTSKKMISVGRLSKEKRFDMLIEIWSQFIVNNPGWELYIYGDGALKDKLQRVISELNLTNSVFLCGFTGDINSAYSKCSINLCASASEGFGLMAIEGMAAGLPFIAFDLPPFRDFVQDGKSGYLINNGDLNMFVYKMDLLANNFELRKQMSEKCKIIASRFSINSIMNKWDHIFDT